MDRKEFERLARGADTLVDERLAWAGAISDDIAAHPEISEQEFRTSALLADLLGTEDFEVERPYFDMPTAFQGVLRRGEGPTVALLVEYDALPEIGHACGHNLHGVMSLLAGLVLAKTPGWSGTLRVVGTPAEETNGAKIAMAAAGLFDDCDLALMIHCSAGHSFVDYRSLAMDAFEFTFLGRTAHAAASPWEGINALNGVQLLFHGIDMLRQHVRPEIRMHGVIREGGKAPNIVPERAVARLYVRSPWRNYLKAVIERVLNCARGAALATGTEVSWTNYELSFDEMLPNPTAERMMMDVFADLGIPTTPCPGPMGSTDVGNVSWHCPALQPELAVTERSLALHTREFAEAVVGEKSRPALAQGTKALVRAALRTYLDPDLRAAMRRELEQARKKITFD
jgi:amidohydrolase